MYMSPAELLLSEIIESCDLYGNFCTTHNSPIATAVSANGCKRWNDALEEVVDFADEVRRDAKQGH